jgi:outer membrane protein assembly factor BamB
MRAFKSLTLAAILVSVTAVGRGDDWPQWLGPKRDSVWRETGLIDKFPEGGPKVLWRTPIDGGYAGPAVAGGRVFVTDYVTDGKRVNHPAVRAELKGSERVLCFDAGTGKPLWKHEYDCPYKVSYPAGPRCTPTVHDGKVYTLGAMGHLFCLDAATGMPVWSKDLMKEYKTEPPTWGCAAHPLVDGKKLICLVGGEGSTVVAFDKDTGKELWKAMTVKNIGYCPPTIIEAGGKRQLIIWHSETINGLDPETGAVYWSEPLKPGAGMSIMTPRYHGNYLFAGGAFEVSALLKLAADKPAAEVVWRGTARTSVAPINSTPFLEDGHVYGVDRMGQLRGIKLETGERLWETFAATTGDKEASSATAFIVKNGDRFFLMSDTGHLIIARLSPKGYEEISRAKVLEPTNEGFGRKVVWSHPAFSNRCVFARNDKELVCVSLAKDGQGR